MVNITKIWMQNYGQIECHQREHQKLLLFILKQKIYSIENVTHKHQILDKLFEFFQFFLVFHINGILLLNGRVNCHFVGIFRKNSSGLKRISL